MAIKGYERSLKRGHRRLFRLSRLEKLPDDIAGPRVLADALGLQYMTVYMWMRADPPLPAVEVEPENPVTNERKHYIIEREKLIKWLYKTKRLTESSRQEID
jgi:hypothetical protein